MLGAKVHAVLSLLHPTNHGARQVDSPKSTNQSIFQSISQINFFYLKFN
jgi:hypothetical protein